MKSLPWIFIILAFVLIIGGIRWTTYTDMPLTEENTIDWKEGALRGDYWGGHLTAVTSFAGTLLFVAGLLFQTSELKLQREDISLSREVSKKQVTELEKQTRIAKHQSIVTQIIEIANYCNTLRIEVNVLIDEVDAIADQLNHIKRIDSLKQRILACNTSHRMLLENEVLSKDEKISFAKMINSGILGDPYELDFDQE